MAKLSKQWAESRIGTDDHEIGAGVPALHVLKTWPCFFDAIRDGRKTFEVRKNDRCFKMGDRLLLQCWNPHTETYDGRSITVLVTYILDGGRFGIEPEYVVMALSPVRVRESVQPI